MIDAAVLQRENMGMFEDTHARSPHDDYSLNSRIASLKELASALLKEVQSLEETRITGDASGGGSLNLPFEVRRFETEIIRCALLRAGGSQRRAARLLGVKATTLNAKIKRYKIKLDVDDTALDDTAPGEFDACADTPQSTPFETLSRYEGEPGRIADFGMRNAD